MDKYVFKCSDITYRCVFIESPESVLTCPVSAQMWMMPITSIWGSHCFPRLRQLIETHEWAQGSPDPQPSSTLGGRVPLSQNQAGENPSGALRQTG